MHRFPENRLYRALSNPLALSAGILLLGLSLVRTPNFFFCAAPGFVLCFAWLLIALHRMPDSSWQPRKLSLRALADARSVRVGSDLILTGQMRIARVASPIALSKTLSIRSQSSSFLLATAAALTCSCITEQTAYAAIHHSLTALGVDPEKMQKQWRLLSFDAPDGFTGVTVRDGSGTRCFCYGDPLPMILACGQLLTGSARPMETEDRTALLRTLEDMRKAGGSVIAYAMADDPSQPPENAVFLGMLSMEPELFASAPQEIAALTGEADVFADFPDSVTPEAIRGMVHPSAQCPDVPVGITLRPRRSGCMAPVSDRTDGWSSAFLQWRRWSRELLLRTRFSVMALLPAVLWLLLAAFQPGNHALTLTLLPALLFLWAQRSMPSPSPSPRWLILWPAITLLLAAFIGVLFPADDAASVFLPGMSACSIAAHIMFLLPMYFSGDARRRRILLIIFAVAAIAAAVILWFIAPGSLAAPLAVLLGGGWGAASMHFLCHRLEDRL